ncbi:YIP1 family protein [Flavobacterium sp. GCM10027622]|uniref:YIP1 family protein n=1 Tax=unclassified Flavobacterium TaxID=196869 RepID=UPI00361C8BA2
MKWQTIFNPFSIFSEKQLLLSGIVLSVAGTFIGYYCNSSFNGTLDMHLIEDSKLLTVALENAIDISVVTVLLFALGKYLNSKTRFVDILNTAFWYRLPIYIVAFISYAILPADFNDKVKKNIHTPEKIFSNPLEIIMSAVLGIAILLCLAYAIVLLVNGFKTATNTKKWQNWATFGFVLLVSEGITQYLIRHLL